VDRFKCDLLKCYLSPSACGRRHAKAEARVEAFRACAGCPIGRANALAGGLIEEEPPPPTLSVVKAVAIRRAYIIRVMMWGGYITPAVIRRQVLDAGLGRVSGALIVKDLKSLVRVGFVEWIEVARNRGMYRVRPGVRDMLTMAPPTLTPRAPVKLKQDAFGWYEVRVSLSKWTQPRRKKRSGFVSNSRRVARVKLFQLDLFVGII